MIFKQYLHGAHPSEHCISCAKTRDLRAAVELVSAEDATIDEIRPAKVLFDTNEDIPDTGDFLIFTSGQPLENDPENDYWYVKEYVSALRGEFQKRLLGEIKFFPDHIVFNIIVFDEKGQCNNDVCIHLVQFPPRYSMIVKMESVFSADGFIMPDTYIIRNLAEVDQPMQIEIEEFANSKLLRTRELGEDDLGKFELITEP